jgi:hypothetical protein
MHEQISGWATTLAMPCRAQDLVARCSDPAVRKACQDFACRRENVQRRSQRAAALVEAQYAIFLLRRWIFNVQFQQKAIKLGFR